LNKECEHGIFKDIFRSIITYRTLLERVKRGEKFDFIEIMACPGGCIGGGGQPIISHPDQLKQEEYRQKRAEALFKVDLASKNRKSHENPAVKQLYEEFLGYPLSPKAKELLHTKYVARDELRQLKFRSAAARQVN